MKAILFSLLLLFSLPTQEAEYKVITLVAEELRPYDDLLNAVIQIESGGDCFAVGDTHLKKHSYGLLQIRESRLDDFNKQTGGSYSISDLFDPEISKRIFFFYCQGDYESVAKSWNAGPNWETKESVKIYWKNVQKYLYDSD